MVNSAISRRLKMRLAARLPISFHPLLNALLSPSLYPLIDLLLTISFDTLLTRQFKKLLLAAAYVALGRASLLLIGGYRLTPGVGLGSLLLNLWIGWETQHGFHDLASSLVVMIALGVMAQASFGAWLFRHIDCQRGRRGTNLG